MSPLHVEVSGRGTPLVLWHGWGMNLRIFDSLRESLGATHRVLAVDLPGHGRSAWSGTETIETQLQLLLETLPESATLLGWSLGSQWALRAAGMAPERVRKLVLINATPRFVAGSDWPHGVAAGVLAHFAEGLQTRCAETLSDFLDLQLRGARGTAQDLQKLRAAMSSHGAPAPAALTAGLQMLADSDLRVDATTVATPTLVIGGQYDRVTPPGAARALAALMPCAHHVEIPRAAHAPFLSHPAQLLATLQEFLRRE